jgi:hypothetical protein
LRRKQPCCISSTRSHRSRRPVLRSLAAGPKRSRMRFPSATGTRVSEVRAKPGNAS